MHNGKNSDYAGRLPEDRGTTSDRESSDVQKSVSQEASVRNRFGFHNRSRGGESSGVATAEPEEKAGRCRCRGKGGSEAQRCNGDQTYANAKKAVGHTKICPDSYVRRIDPVWVFGPAPHGFWREQVNRRNYLLWLADKLGFRWMEDFYRITHEDLKRHCGQGLAQLAWNASAILGVEECFPEYDWKEWLFVSAPRKFWHDKANHRRYMDWLGQQLGYRRPEDWYGVTTRDFQQHKGGAFLLHYHSSVSEAVMSHLPDFDWKEWMFASAPHAFWTSRKNRHRYLKWLGEQLGYRHWTDWYALKGKDFRRNFGGECLKYYKSPTAAVKDLFPRHAWCEWEFSRVPKAFWRRPENRRRYTRWLGETLGLRRLTDWQRIRARDFLNNCGGGLVFAVGSYRNLLRECLPKLDGDRRDPAAQPFSSPSRGLSSSNGTMRSIASRRISSGFGTRCVS